MVWRVGEVKRRYMDNTVQCAEGTVANGAGARSSGILSVEMDVLLSPAIIHESRLKCAPNSHCILKNCSRR